MKHEIIKSAVNLNNIEWKLHSFKRMLERGISRKDVIDAIINGEIIENYPDDHPFPSCLIMKYISSGAIHVVIAYNEYENKVIIITAYNPDNDIFESDYKTRRNS